MTCNITTNINTPETATEIATIATQSAIDNNQVQSEVTTQNIESSVTILGLTSVLESCIVNKQGDIMEETLQLGEDIPLNKVYCGVCLIDNKIYLADITEETRRNIIGIVLQSGVTDQFVKVKTGGRVANVNWNWIADGKKKIYLESNGELTQVPPSNLGFLEVGYPLSPSVLFIDIEEGDFYN